MVKQRLLLIKEKLKGLSLTRAKIFRFLVYYVVPLFITPIVAITDFYVNINPGHALVLYIYILLNYFMVRFFLFLNRSKYDVDSLYIWLDNLDGADDLLQALFLKEKNSSLLENLELVYNKFMALTKHDKKKLKLLKGYFKSLIEEGPQDLLNKTILSIAVAILIWVISRGTLWGLSTVPDGGVVSEVSPLFLTVLNFSTYIIEFLLFLAIFIKDYFKSKMRNKIMLEVLDVCIDEVS